MKRPATRTEIAKRQKTSRTTVYRAMKYLETRGKFYEPRKPVTQPTRYRYMKKETLESGRYAGFRREYYHTPTRTSVMYLLETKKPDVVMLQGWFYVRVIKTVGGKKEMIHDGISSGISIPIDRGNFDFDDKYSQLKRYVISNTRVLFETKEVDIYFKQKRLNTIIYFGEGRSFPKYKVKPWTGWRKY